MVVPKNVRIYHIVHISKLPAIIKEGFLVSDAEIQKRTIVGETIGMRRIKERRLSLPLSSCPGLKVGDCVPFYFCPRSPMLYVLNKDNSPDLEYHGGQEPIVHLAAYLKKAIEWASANKIRWAFTNSNAGSYYFEDYADIKNLDKIDWEAVKSTQWLERRDKKQAEFLVERFFSWDLFDEIGVYSIRQKQAVHTILGESQSLQNINVSVEKEWYY